MRVSFISLDEENNKVSFQSEAIKIDNVYKFKDESTTNTYIELDLTQAFKLWTMQDDAELINSGDRDYTGSGISYSDFKVIECDDVEITGNTIAELSMNSQLVISGLLPRA